MKKIVVIGSSGAGKSTFARALGSTLNTKVVHLDRLFWGCGWQEKTDDERRVLLQALLHSEESWIIEGNYLRFAQLHVDAADTIIFLNTPIPLCIWRLIKRHFIVRDLERPDIPDGCKDRLTPGRLWRVLIFRFDGWKVIAQTLLTYSSKEIVRLKSVQQVAAFLGQSGPYVESGMG